MKKPIWTPVIGAVLSVATEKQERTSKKGTTYTTDIVPEYPCIAIGTPTEKHDENGYVSGYSYEVYEPKTDLGGFEITAPEKLEIKGMANVIFYGLRGGALQNRPTGWFKADRVELAKKKEQ